MTTSLAPDDAYKQQFALKKSQRALASIPTGELLPTESNYQPQGHFLNHPATILVGAALVAQSLWSGAVLGMNVWIFWCIVSMTMIFFGRRRQMFALRENQRGVALLNGGRVDEAAQIFEALTRSQRGTSSHSVYVFNRGVAYMLQGRLKRAFSLFNSVRRSRQFVHLQAHGPTMFADMATCLALEGDLDEAERFLKKARKASVGKEAAKLILSEAIILLRRGHVAEAHHSIRRHLHHAQDALRVPSRRALIVLYAFSSQGAGNASSILRSLGAVTPGEFDWLTVSWSEMRQFVDQFHRI